jgi:NADPH:quinone reductase-like Zn-dependent oxidoreductase
VVPHDGAIAHKPRTMGFADAVTLVFGGHTARGFFHHTTLGPGTTVLVNGAAGAVGTAAVQLARAAGADVTAVCRASDTALVTGLGATRVIDYTTADFADEDITYDVIVDCVGNAQFDRAGTRLRPGGALLLVVTDLRGLLAAPIRARRTGTVIATTPSAGAVDLAAIVALADAGEYVAVRDRTFDLSDVAAAHRYVDQGHKKGNVVLTIATQPETDPAPTRSARLGGAS